MRFALACALELCVAVGTSSESTFACGEVPRSVLLDNELIPSEMADIRCPRGQDGDEQPGEDDPTELEFLMCGLVSTRKFVVWTPHFFVENTPELKRLLDWAKASTTCDFALADDCPAGFLLHHSHASSAGQVRCLPDFDITAQPSKHALVDIAIQLFDATSVDEGVDSLSHLEAEMAYGCVLGYPKFSTRTYLLTGPWQDEVKAIDFDESYQVAVDWVLKGLEDCCAGTQLYEDIATWPEKTNTTDASVGDLVLL